MTVHARLATVLAAAALLVGVSATTGAVAGSLVTSRDIKDGTIQSRDLDKQVKASLHKGATALRAVPRNSVGSATVRDGSLRLSDLVTATGTQQFNQTLRAGECTPLPAVDTGHATSGALVFAQSSLGADFTISAQPDLTSSTAIDITVCNNGGVDYVAADGPDGDAFRWELIAK